MVLSGEAGAPSARSTSTSTHPGTDTTAPVAATTNDKDASATSNAAGILVGGPILSIQAVRIYVVTNNGHFSPRATKAGIVAHMLGFGTAARGARTAVSTGNRVINIVNHRSWLAYLKNETLIRALNAHEDDSDQRLQEIADVFSRLLDSTEIPREETGGFVAGIARTWRRSVSQGMRYPRYDGAARQTFWERLYRWSRAAAETPQGQEMLREADFFCDNPDVAHVFAMRMVAATYQVLLKPIHKKGPEKYRMAMADAVNYGYTDQQRAERRRVLQIVVRAISSGGAAVVVSQLGLHNDVLESLGLGFAAVVVTASVDLSQGGLGHLTTPMKSARLQAYQWLRSLTSLLALVLVRTSDSLREQASGDVEMLIKVLGAMASGDLVVEELPGTDELLRGLSHVQNTADRVRDDELGAALIEVETAIKYDLGMLPDAAGKLLNLVHPVVQERDSGGSPYSLPPPQTRELPPERPHRPGPNRAIS
ncbi:hypothetical protein [Actinomadura bangladeshensis]|uniref:Uncharacterized protein n=1 Tax=Actinomadura bangladeshensis TaxID=453573 RepID=A0A6L9QVD9_9ACTN|nr:hypothetical protein [Actinomadura bangladeshensis]NEA29469.1 hypothetical protein [Actinomadura bangladeshensis]